MAAPQMQPQMQPSTGDYTGWLYNGRLFYDPEKEMPNMQGKVAIITGANSGLGFELTRLLAKNGARVVMAVRRPHLGQKAAQQIKTEFPAAQLDVMNVDLASFRSIKSFADQFLAQNLPLHLLVNNAGEFFPPARHVEGGFDVTLATNYFGPFFLTHLLLDKLVESAPARIVNVSSVAHSLGYVDWSDLKGENYKTSGLPVYGQSKLYLLLFGMELQKRLKGTGVDVFTVHPGVSDTPLFRKVDYKGYVEAPLVLLQKINPLMIQGVKEGVKALAYAATAPELKDQGHRFLGPVMPFIGTSTNWLNTTERWPLNIYAYWPGVSADLFKRTSEICKKIPA